MQSVKKTCQIAGPIFVQNLSKMGCLLKSKYEAAFLTAQILNAWYIVLKLFEHVCI